MAYDQREHRRRYAATDVVLSDIDWSFIAKPARPEHVLDFAVWLQRSTGALNVSVMIGDDSWHWTDRSRR